MKRALITGVTGQDGAYLSQFLLEKGYQVHGIKRRSSSFNTERIDSIYENNDYKDAFHLHYGDLADSTNLIRLVEKVRPDEIYNLGAMSHVRVSFDAPEYTADIDGIGTLRLLEAMRITGLAQSCRFYQASTSELYGKVQAIPQKEDTPFYPRSPYAAAKMYAYWITVNYREAYNMHANNGILFNHESPLRGETFVTRKITMAVTAIKLGLQEKLELGNLDSKRDWGFAGDYVEGIYLTLQNDQPGDYVLATGQTQTIRNFVEKSFAAVDIPVEWVGKRGSLEEKGINPQNGQTLVTINPRYFRPTEVDILVGDASKARKELGWEPKVSYDELVQLMVEADLKRWKEKKNIK